VIAPNGSALALTQQGNEPDAQFLAGRSIEAPFPAERFPIDAPYIAGDRTRSPTPLPLRVSLLWGRTSIGPGFVCFARGAQGPVRGMASFAAWQLFSAAFIQPP
jgi:GSH-dependent disulfide-bond oxidoreductase